MKFTIRHGNLLQKYFSLQVSMRNVSYVQGQAPEPRVREYFYYIDHQGMLFLDDSKMKNFTSCFKEKKFLKFFFTQLRGNTTNRYRDDFPYLSICGRERNFVRCDDRPIVYTHIITAGTNPSQLAHNHAGDLLTIEFQPHRIFMLPETGRVYHPAPVHVGSIGLVRSKLAIELSQMFQFGDGEAKPPTAVTFRDRTYQLDKRWFYEAISNNV